MLISHSTAPEQPVEWAHSPKMVKRISTSFNFFFYKIRNFSGILRPKVTNSQTMVVG